MTFHNNGRLLFAQFLYAGLLQNSLAVSTSTCPAPLWRFIVHTLNASGRLLITIWWWQGDARHPARQACAPDTYVAASYEELASHTWLAFNGESMLKVYMQKSNKWMRECTNLLFSIWGRWEGVWSSTKILEVGTDLENKMSARCKGTWTQLLNIKINMVWNIAENRI